MGLENFQKLHLLHEALWQSALKLDWDTLSTGWQKALPLFEVLEKTDLATLPLKEKEEAVALIEKIVLLERQIAERTQDWMADVRPMLDVFDRTAKKSAQATL